jgi:hypothetical protein
MKYMLLAYTKQADWENVDVTSPEFQAMCDFYEGSAWNSPRPGVRGHRGLAVRPSPERSAGPMAVGRDGRPVRRGEGGAGELRHHRLREP